MVNSVWHTRFQEATLTKLVALVSDHSPILLDMAHVLTERKTHRFGFEKKWLEELDIIRVVSTSWEGFQDFPVLSGLQATGDVLLDWVNHIAQAWRRNKQDLEQRIESMQGKSNSDSLEALLEAKKNLAALFVKERSIGSREPKHIG